MFFSHNGTEFAIVVRAKMYVVGFSFFFILLATSNTKQVFAHDSKHSKHLESSEGSELEELKDQYGKLVEQFVQILQDQPATSENILVHHPASNEDFKAPEIYPVQKQQESFLALWSQTKSNTHVCKHGCSHNDSAGGNWWQSTKGFFQKKAIFLHHFFSNPYKFFSESYHRFEEWRKKDPHASRIDPRHFESSLGIYLAKAMQEKVVHTYRHLELESVHVIYSHDRSIATYIVVSQALWEAFETVISNMILPGSNIHVACTIFNGALLATAFPMDCVQKLSSNHMFKEAAWKRLMKAFYIYAENHILKRYSPKSYQVLNIEARSHIPVTGSDLKSSHPDSSILKHDFEFFLSNTSNKASKLWFVTNLISLMGTMIKQSHSFLEEFEHHEFLEHHQLRSLHAVSGRLHYIKLSFQTHLEYLAYSDKEHLHRITSDLYISWMQEFGEFLRLQHTLFAQVVDSPSSLNFKTSFDSLWEASENLLRGLKKMRSIRLDPKDSQCASVMIE